MDMVQFEERLRDLDYPVTKQQLIEFIDLEGADDRLRQAIFAMPGDSFDDPQAVSEAVGGLRDD